MTQTADTRPWTLCAAFARREERDTCRTEFTDNPLVKTYNTEMTDGTPALGIDASEQDLAPLLTYIAVTYNIKSISLYPTA